MVLVMSLDDARPLPPAAQQTLRRRAVHVPPQEKTRVEGAATLGVRRQVVGRRLKRYRARVRPG